MANHYAFADLKVVPLQELESLLVNISDEDLALALLDLPEKSKTHFEKAISKSRLSQIRKRMKILENVEAWQILKAQRKILKYMNEQL